VISVAASVDVLEQLLRRAHELDASGIMYLLGEAALLPLPDASVDAVLLHAALGRVAELAGAVPELARVLRPGGRLSLCEPLRAAGAPALDWSGLVRDLGGWADVRGAVEDPGERWSGDRESTREPRRGSRGETVPVRRHELYLSARRV
jgi:SAM-dependent methyltransferase